MAIQIWYPCLYLLFLFLFLSFIISLLIYDMLKIFSGSLIIYYNFSFLFFFTGIHCDKFLLIYSQILWLLFWFVTFIKLFKSATVYFHFLSSHLLFIFPICLNSTNFCLLRHLIHFISYFNFGYNNFKIVNISVLISF